MKTEQNVGEAFDQILHKEIFKDIHEAINSLYFEIHVCPSAPDIKYFDKMIKEMKIATQHFIEQQSTSYRKNLTDLIARR